MMPNTPNVPRYIIVHHTGGTDANPLFDSSNQEFSIIDQYHKERWNSTTKSALGFFCGYQYFIDKTGKVTQARLETEGGAHTIGMNYSSIGICLAGNFDFSFPTIAQLQALTKLIQEIQLRWNIPASRIVPHRTFASKTCYGKHLSDAWAQELIKAAAIPDKSVRSLIRNLFAAKVISSPKLSLIFGSIKKGPLSNYSICN